MRLILASSLDGYLSRGPSDDMRWTGPEDKNVFKLLTAVGGTCYAGRATFERLPSLPGRTVHPLSRDEGKGLTLGRAFYRHPEAWLIGGPTVAMEAIDAHLVDQVFMCYPDVVLGERGEPFPDPRWQRDGITPYLANHIASDNAGSYWRRTQRIKLPGGTTVDSWSYNRAHPRSEP